MTVCSSDRQHPTKAICPILLEDFRKIMVERKGESNFFTSQMIKDCMQKGEIRTVDLQSGSWDCTRQ